MRVLIIANPGVGINKEKRAVVEKIASLITGTNGSVDITYSMKPGMGRKYASMSTAEGYDAVYAAGGDGTINDVASGLVGSAIPLGIIPLGTGNGLARGFNIPLEQERFIRVLLTNKTMAIDIGKISSNYFFATAGIGYDAYIANDFNQQRLLKRSIFTYFLLGIKNYFFKRSENLTLIIDGREIRRKVFFLTIANTPQYGGGAIIAPQADPRSGKLIAVFMPKLNIFDALPALKKLFDGTVANLKQIEFFEFKTLKIKREVAGYYHADGEVHKSQLSLNVSVIPASLKIIVP
jgi:YegS/Rv2252/BmrU family lipid kinase